MLEETLPHEKKSCQGQRAGVAAGGGQAGSLHLLAKILSVASRRKIGASCVKRNVRGPYSFVIGPGLLN